MSKTIKKKPWREIEREICIVNFSEIKNILSVKLVILKYIHTFSPSLCKKKYRNISYIFKKMCL